MKPWKALEKKVAELLGGKRIPTVPYRKAPDVVHPKFAIETKYRKTLPKIITDGMEQAARYEPEKIPLLVMKGKGQKGAYVVMRIHDLLRLLN